MPPLPALDATTWAPDVAMLSRLANEFFAAPPGHAEPGPTPPMRPAAGGRDLSSPLGEPSTGALPSSPTELGTPPVALQPVESSARFVPAGPAPVPSPSSPYYFLDEAAAFTPASFPTHAATDVPALPDEATLQALLTVLPAELAADDPPTEHPERYFLRLPTERTGRPDPHPPFDVNAVRRDFPILSEQVNGHQLVWLDNAATTQKPRTVIDRLTHFYEHENSNVHRAAHELAARATDAYEGARAKVGRFLGASSAEEIVFVRGATEGINLIAQSWGRHNLREGDEIVISHLEHHANIVPWHQLVSETGAVLRVIPVDSDGQILLDEYQRLLGDRTKLVSVAHVSNALGTVTPISEVIDLGHRAGACVLVDGAQSVSHMPVDVRSLDADFFVLSGHKIFGPTGIGAVYGKASVLQSMPPWQGGGSMIRDVTLERSLYQDPPMRFEAGTGNIADAVGLGAALDYLERLGMANIERYEHELLAYATHAMLEVPGLCIIGTAPHKASVLSFVLEGSTPEEVSQALNQEGIAVRAGHHCAQPILRRFGLEATVRASLALYNTTDEVDRMVGVLRRLALDTGRARR
ncbi:MAG: family 2A encapsulin nanocompartment cargo protein cysteine desulfurase [Acidimicrobiales bacterium]